MDAGGLGDGGGDAQDGFAGAFAVAYVGGVEGAQDGPPVAGGFVEDVVGGEGVADDVGGGLARSRGRVVLFPGLVGRALVVWCLLRYLG